MNRMRFGTGVLSEESSANPTQKGFKIIHKVNKASQLLEQKKSCGIVFDTATLVATATTKNGNLDVLTPESTLTYAPIRRHV